MSAVNFNSLSLSEKQDLMDSIDTIISDCDGVIWNSSGVIDGAVHTINTLIEFGKTIFFLTNNSTKTKEQFHNKIQKYGFNVSINNLFNSSTLTANYLGGILPPDKLVYVVGSNAICEELCKKNIKSFGTGKDEAMDNILEQITSAPIQMKDNVGAVVIGFDQYISYMKMLKATTYLKDNKCLFIATNTDELFPSGTNYVIPGTGAILAGIQVASGRQPFIIGKPSTYVAKVLQTETNLDPKRTLLIGDRCNTDILTGKRCSFKTLLVLTGVHSVNDVIKFQQSDTVEDQMSVPDYYSNVISDLLFK